MAQSSSPATAASSSAVPRGTLGTFGGVFTPSILTILGLILFLRLGFVVGNGGLGWALVIIVMANLVSVLTSTSLAAAATNIRVKGGGDYYLISRTLGMEFGGPLGLVLYLAQSVSIAFYAIGFAEAAVSMAGGGSQLANQLVALGAVLLLFVIAWVGADAATRLQYVIMAALVLALIAIFVGLVRGFDGATFAASWTPSGKLPFWTLFAIFFPAVTGFTQGVAMSGDLENASESIPRGTFAAVFLSAGIYIALALLLAGSIPGAELENDTGAMHRMAAVPWLVDAGVVAATISSALASLMGAPRILQSLAADRVFPGLKPFAVGHGPTSNPRRGLLLSTAIAVLVIGLGDLNVIAPVVSMFFLISYGLLNYATYAEATSNSPSFRPRFRWFDRRLSLIGCLGCLGAMVAISPTAGAIALVALFAMHQYLSKRQGVARWADSSRGHRLHTVREQLLLAGSGPEHARDWRPVILAFSDDPQRRERILRFASWIEAGTGFTTAVRMILGDDAKTRRQRAEAEVELKAELQRHEFEAFPLVLAVPDFDTGFPALVQAHGLGTVRANLVLLNWFDGTITDPDADPEHRLRSYGRPLRTALRLQRNVVIYEATEEELKALAAIPRRERRIDVWFRGDGTARLELLLAHLMTRHEEWSGAWVRLMEPVQEGQDRDVLHAELTATLSDWRIDATIELVDAPDHASMVALSKDAAAVFLPFRLAGEIPTCPFTGQLETLLSELPIVALVLAAQDIDLDAEPESGVFAEVAQATDAAEEKEKRASKVSRESEKVAKAAEEVLTRLEKAREKGAEPEALAALEKELAAAQEDAEWQRRKALKAQAVASSAGREAAAASGEFTVTETEETEELLDEAGAADAATPASEETGKPDSSGSTESDAALEDGPDIRSESPPRP